MCTLGLNCDAHRDAERRSNGQSQALRHQADYHADEGEEQEAARLQGQPRQKVAERQEDEVEEHLQGQSADSQGRVVGCDPVPAVEALLAHQFYLLGV